MTENEDTELNGDSPEKRPSSHAANADPISPPAVTRTTPGRATGGGRMELHSKHAHSIFYGRKDLSGKLPNIVGLARFAAQLAKIHNAATANDPYADWALIDIEEKLVSAEAVLANNEQHIKGLLCGQNRYEVDVQTSVKPVVIQIKFQSPLAFKAARLLLSFDEVVMLALTARHQALMGNDDFSNCVNNTSRAVRGTFELVNSWRSTGVTRHDIAANNAVARRSIEIYEGGIHRDPQIPEDILQGTRRSQFAPTIRTRSNELTDVVDETVELDEETQTIV